MNLSDLLHELEHFGRDNDARYTDRAQRMSNITRETGQFLLLLIRALKARRILEIGTSNGYSTLWLAQAVQPVNGCVTTVERSPYKLKLAHANFARSGLQTWIDSREAEAGEFLSQQPDGQYDFIFLDSHRASYPAWWEDLHRVLAVGGLLAADNAISHPDEMEDFVRMVQETRGCMCATLPIGKGELLVLKEQG